MKKINFTGFNDNKIVKQICLALLALSPIFFTDTNAQSADTEKGNKISVSADILNLDYSYKNKANSILTWRDLNMMGASIDFESKKGWGVRGNFAVSLGYGYSTDDDIDNHLKSLTQHFTKAFRIGAAAYKNKRGGNQKIGIAADYTYFNNCKAGNSMISKYNDQKILELAEYISQGFILKKHDQAQRYHLIQIKPWYEYQKNLMENANCSIDALLAGNPIVYAGIGNWNINKKFIKCGLELGGSAALKLTYKKNFFIKIFNQASFGYGGLSFNNSHSKKDVSFLRNTKSNILGMSVGVSFRTKNQ
ncbi:MAG: hypothetical protein LBK26_01955 [Rickettsiales bacterium]|jgi:hypothetical protein|nr:hypothetical protein [Rickettsiales bacterium]